MGDKAKLEGKTIVWVMGGPGSGRGTQCEKICLKFGDFVHLSSGELMKAEVMSGSSRGGKLYQLMSSGHEADCCCRCHQGHHPQGGCRQGHQGRREGQQEEVNRWRQLRGFLWLGCVCKKPLVL